MKWRSFENFLHPCYYPSSCIAKIRNQIIFSLTKKKKIFRLEFFESTNRNDEKWMNYCFLAVHQFERSLQNINRKRRTTLARQKSTYFVQCKGSYISLFFYKYSPLFFFFFWSWKHPHKGNRRTSTIFHWAELRKKMSTKIFRI